MLLKGLGGSSQVWTQVPGAAKDIAIDRNGSVAILGIDGSVYAWNGSSWAADPTGGRGTSLTVDASGSLWTLAGDMTIWKRTASTWEKVPGWGKDIASNPVDPTGKMWIIGPDSAVYSLVGASWVKDPDGGAGNRIAVDTFGRPWVVNSLGEIWTKDSKWTRIPGSANSVFGGLNGAVYVVGPDGGIYQWASGSWSRVGDGSGVSVAAARDGTVWSIAGNGTIWVFQKTADAPTTAPGSPATTPTTTPPPATVTSGGASGTVLVNDMGLPTIQTASSNAPKILAVAGVGAGLVYGLYRLLKR